MPRGVQYALHCTRKVIRRIDGVLVMVRSCRRVCAYIAIAVLGQNATTSGVCSLHSIIRIGFGRSERLTRLSARRFQAFDINLGGHRLKAGVEAANRSARS